MNEGIKFATWNVNSIRIRLEHIKQWLAQSDVDVLLLQETKVTDDKFPLEELHAIGYPHCQIYGQPAYNGVAIISRHPLQDCVCGMPSRPDDRQARLIAATVSGYRVMSAYIPMGQHISSDKYAYKMGWLADLADYLKGQALPTIVGGDFNIAPTDEDVYDIDDWGREIITSDDERAAWQHLLGMGYQDAYRLFNDETNDCFTWWDYRQGAFAKNLGLRIDTFLINSATVRRAVDCLIDKTPRGWERPSDHTPVVLVC